MKSTDSQPPPSTPIDISFQEATATHQVLSSLKSGETNPHEAPNEPTRQLEFFRPMIREDAPEDQRALTDFPAVGERFLSFHLISELGKGTFGRVYLARQGELADRPVALKVSTDVVKESRSLARLQHVNIVPIHSVHHAPPFQAICMPFLGVRTLTDLLSNLRRTADGGTVATFDAFPLLRGRSRTEAVLRLARGIADGLGHAHERGVLHCDLKPANVLLSDEGEPMLLDFNLSRDFRQEATGSVGGSFNYMAPEHLRAFLYREGDFHEPSDLYSLGVILHELLTNTLPFPSHKDLDFAERAKRLLDERSKLPPEPETDDPEVTPAVRSILRMLLEPAPANRYQSAAEVREDIDRHLTNRPLKYAPDRSWAERWSKFRRRNPRMTSVAALTFLSLSLVGVLATAVVVREQRLARLDARDTARAIEADRRELEFVMTAFTAVNRLDSGLDEGHRILERHGLADDAPPDRLRKLAPLADDEREKTMADLAEVVYLTASGHVLKGQQSTTPDRGAEFERAEELLARLHGLRGNAPALRGVLLLQADIAASRGQLDEAARLKKLAAETPLQSAREYHHAAIVAIERKQFREAIPLLHEALRLEPGDFNSWFQLGVCMSEREQHQEAASAFSTCLALRSDSYAAYLNRGVAYRRLSRHPAARRDFDEAIRLHPRCPTAYVERAFHFEAMARERAEQGRTHEVREMDSLAEADLTEAIRLVPSNSRLHLLRAKARKRLHDEAGAREDQETGLRLVPRDAVEWVVRGLAKIPFGPSDEIANPDPVGALADFDEALARDPSYLHALRNKAHVLARYLKDNEGALAVLAETIRHYPEDAAAWGGRGTMFARLGKKEEALRDAERALALDHSPATQYQLAGIYALVSKDDPDARSEAFRLLKAALSGGFGFNYLDIDHDLDPIRDDTRFRPTIEAARKRREGK